MAGKTGAIDAVLTAPNFVHDHGTGLDDPSPSEISDGVVPFPSSKLNIAKVAAPRMGGESGGTMIALFAPGRTHGRSSFDHVTERG